MNKIEHYLKGVKSLAIAGHVSPDGDCIGSCLGLWNYLRDNYPEIRADVYLETIPHKFMFLCGAESIITDYSENDDIQYDLFVLLDISSKDRIGVAGKLLEKTKSQLCIDHHITNPGGFTHFINLPEASSASEVLLKLLDIDRVSKACAEAVYMGIAHDTGVFRYSSTSPETMRAAALLMEKGIDYSYITDATFFKRTPLQQKLMGMVLTQSEIYLDGIFMAGILTLEDKLKTGFKGKDLDGISGALRDTEGVDVAALLSEMETGECKVSLRSKNIVDVSRISANFGGGGHKKAAGFKIQKKAAEILPELISEIKKQLDCS